MSKRFKNIPSKTRIKEKQTAATSIRKNRIIFSFQHVQSGKYCFSQLSSDDKVQVAESIFKRKDFIFQDLIDKHKYGLGSEKIYIDAISVKVPSVVQDNFVLALRFNGKKPMVGFLQDNIFYVLWFDHDFTLYKH